MSLPEKLSSLRKEEATYRKSEKELLENHRGNWVLVKGKRIDVFHCEDDAFDQDFTKYGDKGFMVRKIEEDKPILITSRNVKL